jgi:hypothetical protein
MMDHPIITAVKTTNDPPKSLQIEYQFYKTALDSEQNTVIIVKQKVNVAFVCLADNRMEDINQERNVGYIIDATQMQL